MKRRYLPRPCFEIRTHRMDVDVDGAPNAYGPRGKKTLDVLKNSRLQGKSGRGNRRLPHRRRRSHGAHRAGPAATRTRGSTFRRRRTPTGIVAEIRKTRCAMSTRRRSTTWCWAMSAEARRAHWRLCGGVLARFIARRCSASSPMKAIPSGDEGSLHLLQALGYPFVDGRDDSVENEGEIDRAVLSALESAKRTVLSRAGASWTLRRTKLGLSKSFASPRASKK